MTGRGVRRRVLLGSLGLAGLLGLSACGDDGSSKSADKPAGQPPVGGIALVSAQNPKLGPIVTDAAGFTVYRFDKDTATPSKSNCAGECASTWPPLTSPADPALTGIEAGLLGSVQRADGSRQVTLAGWPLYKFAADTASGQINGHGVGGVWFAVNPQGGKAGTAPQPASEQPTGKGDYGYG